MTNEQLIFRAASSAHEAEVLLKDIWDGGGPITDYAAVMCVARGKLREAAAAAETLAHLALGGKPSKIGE